MAASSSYGEVRRSSLVCASLAVALGAVVGFASWLPLAPRADGDDRAFSVDAAMRTIETLAVEPHPMGSPALEEVQTRIVERLSTLGLTAQTQTVVAPDWFGPPGATVDVVNVIARIPGTDPTGAVAMVAHVDTVPSTPGANDDTSGVAILLETARVVATGPPLRNDVVLVFTDGEEPAPRFGATAATDHPLLDDTAFVVNLEAVGSSGPSLLVDIAGPQPWVVDVVRDAMPHPVASSLLPSLNAMLGGSSTDFAAFRDAGVAGVDLAYLHGSAIYHTAGDVPSSVNRSTLRRQGDNALGVVLHVADVDLSRESPARSTVFTTVGRSLVVAHPAWLVPTAAVAALAVALALATREGPRDVGRALGRTVGALVLATVVTTLPWVALAGRWTTITVTATALVFAVAVALASLVTVLVTARGTPAATAVGVAVLWSVLALVAFLDAGVGQLLAWPALAGAVAVAAVLVAVRYPWVGRLASVAAVVVATALTLPAAELFLELASPRPGNPDSQLLPVVAVTAVLVSLAAALVAALVRLDRPSWPRSTGAAITGERRSGLRGVGG